MCASLLHNVPLRRRFCTCGYRDAQFEVMKRREFIQALAAVGAASLCGSVFGQTNPAEEKLILSAPLTHSDWMLKAGTQWGEPGVKHMLDACKACGWSKVYWRVLDGGRATYKSEFLLPGGKWDEDSFWTPQNEADRKLMERYTAGVTPQRRKELLETFATLDYGTFDSLAAAVKYGHSIGLEIGAWVSINEDDHGWGIVSKFSREHPQYRWKHRDGRMYKSQLSFAYPAVREYKLAILKELLAKYDIDELFLDWIRTGDVRDNPQNDAKGAADYGYEQPLVEEFEAKYGVKVMEVANNDPRWVAVRARPQTAFMREVKDWMSAQKRKVPIAVMVGHPWHYRGEVDRIDGNLNGLLLDVATWAQEGLMDAAVPAGYYRDGGNPAMAYKALREETKGKCDVWYYGWVPQNVAGFEADFNSAKELGAKQILFWEADYIDDRPNAAELKAAMSKRART